MKRASYNKRLFLNFFLVFLLFTGAVTLFQYQREKQYRVNHLEQKLENYNQQVYRFLKLQLKMDTSRYEAINTLIKVLPEEEIRITIISNQGKVLFDSSVDDFRLLENHLGRPEVQEANQRGLGNAIRWSNTVGKDFYYMAHAFPELYVRTALPYDLDVMHFLKADSLFLYFMVLLFGLAILMLIYLSDRMGKAISRLKDFALQAGKNGPINTEFSFPNNELGEIGEQIIQFYGDLRKTRDALSFEKEKLFKHLHISQEGLAIFSPEKKEILANNYFIQYINVISDTQLVWPDQVFEIPELEPINAFIDKSKKEQEIPSTKYLVCEKQTIRKGGRIFKIQCIVFQDGSFEISINDFTAQEREQTLKQQITHNIAHELKTPVSSIQGYLETMITNPNIPKEKKKFFIDRAYTQALRLADLIQDISLLTKIEEAKDLFVKEEVDLKEIIDNVFQDVHLKLERRNMKLEESLKGALPICGNKSLLYSIFRNLTDNAIAYAGEGVIISVSNYREDDAYYYFSFADSGVGIQDEHLGRVFERFYRVDKGRSRKEGGTGLGLAIVKNAIHFHHGDITAKNRKEGGLEFIFSLRKE